MEHQPISVANELIQRAHRAGRTITPMQVIKLTYYCHAWMLGLYHRPLLNDAIEAWPYGPMIPQLYHCLRQHGGRPLRERIDLYDNGILRLHPYDGKEINILNQVSDKYGHLSGVELSGLTSAPGTPWHRIRTKRRIQAVIPDPVIEDYYAGRLERANRAAAAGER